MKKLLLSAAVLGLFLTSCNKKENCEEVYYEKEYEFCGTEEHKDWDKEDYDDKDDYYDDHSAMEKEDYDADDLKNDKDWDKEDKKWWWKKKKSYKTDDCDKISPKLDQ